MAVGWERVEEVFEAALAVEPAGRDAWLTSACAGDAELRREVEALLAADQACATTDFLQGRISAAVEALVDSAEASRVGEVIGAYRLTGELGRGGMGRVYLAERVDQQYRAEVAIKFVQGGFANPALVARFRSERQILADLNHPNIARLLDGGTTPDGTPFLVMERIAGEPVDRFADAQRLGLRERLGLFMQVCRAVEFAHQALVVHRDLKPSNILVTLAGEAKLLDFGIATLVDSSGEQEETTMLRALTPAYASPEQVRGARATVATDVYSLGVVLYRLLAGREPFQLRGLSPGELERVLTDQEPDRPSVAARRPREAGAQTLPWAGALAGDLDTIVLRALGKTPAERYPSVSALREDLERHLDGRPVLARPTSARYRLGKFVRRYRREVVTGALALVALVAVSVWYVTRLAAERDRSRIAAAEAEQVSGFMTSLFAGADPGTSGGSELSARVLLDSGVVRINRELADQPLVRSALKQTMARAYLNLGLWTQADRLAREVVATRRAALGPEAPATLGAEMLLAEVLDQRSLPDSARLVALGVLARRRPGGTVADTGIAAAQAQVALSDQKLGNYLEADTLFPLALHTWRRWVGASHPRYLSTLGDYAGFLFEKGDIVGADSLRRQQLAGLLQALGPMHREIGPAYGNLALVQERLRRPAAAESLYGEEIAHTSRLYGDTFPALAPAYLGLGRNLSRMGRLAEAESATVRALQLDQSASGGQPSRDVAYDLRALAEVQRLAGRLPQAETNYRAALTMYRPLTDPHEVTLAIPLAGLGMVRLARGDAREAEGLFRRALGIWEAIVTPPHIRLPITRSQLGASLLAQGRLAAAESLLVPAWSVIQQDSLVPDLERAHALGWVLDLFHAQGRSADSLRVANSPDRGAEETTS